MLCCLSIIIKWLFFTCGICQNTIYTYLDELNICMYIYFQVAGRLSMYLLTITWHFNQCILAPLRARCSETCSADVGKSFFPANTICNTLRPRQNSRNFPGDFFKCIFLNENVWISIKISLKFVSKGPINCMTALVQIMAWRRPGDKPLSEPMLVSLLTHIGVTLPQWVNRNVIFTLKMCQDVMITLF